MTLPSEPSYPIADLKALLSQRVGLDLSPIELAEILWLALQRGEVITDEFEAQGAPKTPSPEDKQRQERLPVTSQPSSAKSAAVVAEPPQPTGSTQRETKMEQPIGPALPVNIPESVALRNRQAIARSLRPLMRRVKSKQRQTLDEEATVLQSAETKTWYLVMQPETERWLELAIVIEVTNLLDVWRDTIAEFQQLMERHGAFRNVRTWQLKPNAEGKPQLFLQTSRGLQGSPRSPRELLDASGRRQILLLSDCTSRAWRTGKIPKLLELWSRKNPVAIVQLLPEHYWDRSALKASYPVALRSRRPGALSRDWAIEGLSLRRRQQLPKGLKLPVVTIQPELLGQWAGAIAASNDQPTKGIIFNPRGFQAPPSPTQASPLTAKQLVQRFRNTASEKAQELADMMAVLPVNWSVIRLIQKNLIQEEPWQPTGALYLAEIFLSGLLRPVSAGSEHSSKHQKTPQYDFVEGVRDVLLGSIPISEAQAVGQEVAEAVFKQLPTEVQERVNADIARRYGDALSYFEAFLIPDLPWGDFAAAEIFPFARVTRQVLQRWGSVYAALAEELEQAILPPEAIANAVLEYHLEGIQHSILDNFAQRQHQFRIAVHPAGVHSEYYLTEVELAKGQDFEITVTDYTLLSLQQSYALFELSLNIRFAVRILYFDVGTLSPASEDTPDLVRVVPDQIIDAKAMVRLQLAAVVEESRFDLTELQIEEPVSITASQTNQPSQIPPLQEFEFEVATIAVDSVPDTPPGIDLQPFEFEIVTLERRQVANPEFEEAFQMVDQAVVGHSGEHLSDVQQHILRCSWEGMTYGEMASTSAYTTGSLKRAGTKLWQLLSDVFTEEIKKTNIRAVLERLATLGGEPGLVIHRQQQQGWEFVEVLGEETWLEMVRIPGGSFVMGAPATEAESTNAERPQHDVRIQPFFIGKYPVTQAEWKAVAALPQVNRELDPDPSRFKGSDRPVERVSWYDAVEFCDRLSQLTGRPYRLPSEAEWEYACRAGTTTPFHFGETITTDLANYYGESTYGRGPKGIYRQETTTVGSFGVANAFGLFDMHGNVWEWCLDHWHGDYEGAPTDGSAWVTGGDSDRRLLRGGSWLNDPWDCRSAYRGNNYPDTRYNTVGFRVVCAAARTLA
ncbi:MAG: hypothetical protein OHK0047_10430 [Leptolyngbyaceae cyanobacterium]